MSVLCGKDVIDISKVLSVSIDSIDDYELGELEEEYNGDYPGSVNSLLRDARRLGRSSSSYRATSKSKLGEKIEKALNKYWYEVGLALPRPKTKDQKHDNWTYAAKRQSTFSVGYINSEGDASVSWHFRTDYDDNPVYRHLYGDQEITVSLADDIMPVVRHLAQKQTHQKVKDKKRAKYYLSC